MPLTDPVPSSSFDVLERNIQDTDKFVNQETGTFTNRVGKVIKPIPVIESEANAAIISLGWHQVGLFADGFTYLLQNDIAKDTAGDWYRWNGALPKVVTAGTLPSSDANFVKIDYKSHAELSDRNPADGSSHNADDIKDTTNGGSVQDFIDAQYTTVAELATGKFKVGQHVRLTDRAMGLFLVQTGGAADGYGILDAGNGNAAIYQRKCEFVILEQLGAISSPSFDIVPILISAATFGNKVKAQLPLTYYLGSEYVYPRNSFEITGVEYSPYTAATTFKPMDSHAGLSLFDLNENGSGSGLSGGQYNKLVNCRIDGGMLDFKDPLDPRVNFIGVRGLNTRNETQLGNVSFRNCGKPFSFTGYQHKFKTIDIFECHTGGDLASTGSSIIDGYNILTCYKNWGTLTGVEVRGTVLQQGNDLQKLVDDKGVTCTEVNFTGSFYTEGGNAQIYVTDGSWVTAQNAVFGFAILNAGGYGNYNIRVGAGSSIAVNGGKSVDTKSFLVGGGVSAVAAAKNIHLDIEPNDGRLFDYVDATQLPACENLLVKRSYATIERKNGYSEITYNVYEVNTSTVTVWNQVGNAVNLPHGGQIEIQCAGTNTYDKYRIDFADSTAEASQVIINTIMRNTSGAGDNNVIVAYTAPNITLQGRKNPQRFAMVVKGWGNIWPKPIQ